MHRNPAVPGLATALVLGVVTASALALAGTAAAQTLIGLTADGALVTIDADRRTAGAPLRISGATGRVIGIDQRPADGALYGVTDAGRIVTIDRATGRAREVSRLSEPFDGGGRAVVDFNPAADRLRLMGMNGTNFRVNVETGAVARDGQLAYRAGSPLAETRPRITAGAYTNSVRGARATALYTLDPLFGSYNLQAPPNDGVQQPKAELPPGLPPGIAFDILSDGSGGDIGFLLAGGTLHRLDAASGRILGAGSVTGLPQGVEILDLAALR